MRGYIAISTVLVVVTVVLIITSTVSMTSISELQSALSGIKSANSMNLVESCAEEALLILNDTNSIPSVVTLPEGTCSINVELQSGQDWTFVVSSSVNSFQKDIRVTATRSDKVYLSGWEEI